MRALCSLLVLGILLLARPAAAQETARELYERATAQYALGKYGEAATVFERAFELKPDPAILYNAAQAHRLAGNKQRALDLYSSYLRLYGDRSGKAEVQKHIETLQAALDKDRAASSQSPMTLKTPPTTTPPPAVTNKPTPPPPVVAKPTPPPPVVAKPTPPPVVAKPTPPPPVVAKPTPPPVVVTPPPPPPPPEPHDAIVSAPPRKKKIKPWVWGVVAGAVVVVGVGVGVGVAIGTRGTKDPDPTFGTVNGN